MLGGKEGGEEAGSPSSFDVARIVITSMLLGCVYGSGALQFSPYSDFFPPFFDAHECCVTCNNSDMEAAFRC